MITLQDALDYIGIDYPDDKIIKNVQRDINTARTTIEGAIGKNVFEILADDARLDELMLIYTDEFYSNRGTNAKSNGAIRNLVQTMESQLRIDYGIATKERDSP